jgi:hypothetical protein
MGVPYKRRDNKNTVIYIYFMSSSSSSSSSSSNSSSSTDQIFTDHLYLQGAQSYYQYMINPPYVITIIGEFHPIESHQKCQSSPSLTVSQWICERQKLDTVLVYFEYNQDEIELILGGKTSNSYNSVATLQSTACQKYGANFRGIDLRREHLSIHDQSFLYDESASFDNLNTQEIHNRFISPLYASETQTVKPIHRTPKMPSEHQSRFQEYMKLHYANITVDINRIIQLLWTRSHLQEFLNQNHKRYNDVKDLTSQSGQVPANLSHRQKFSKFKEHADNQALVASFDAKFQKFRDVNFEIKRILRDMWKKITDINIYKFD